MPSTPFISFFLLSNGDCYKCKCERVFFDDTARLKHESCISDPIPEDIWAPNYGGTSYGPVFELAIFKISNYI